MSYTPVYRSQWNVDANARVNDCGPACVAMHAQGRGDLTAINKLPTNDPTGLTNAPDLVRLLAAHGMTGIIEYSDPALPLAQAIKPYSILLINYSPIAAYAQDTGFRGWHWLIYVKPDPLLPGNSLVLDPDYWGTRINEGNLKSYPTAALRSAFRTYSGAPGATAIYVEGSAVPDGATPQPFAQYDVITTNDLFVRLTPDTTIAAIGTMKQGTVVRVAYDYNGWHQIASTTAPGGDLSTQYQGCWCSAAYTKPVVVAPPVDPPPTGTADKYITADATPTLNVRSAPSTGASIVGSLKPGDPVTVITPAVPGGSLLWYKLTKPVALAGNYIAAKYTQDTPLTTPPPSSGGGNLTGMNVDVRNPAGNPNASLLAGAAFVRLVLIGRIIVNNQPVTLPMDQVYATYDPVIAAYHAAGVKVILVLHQDSYADGIPWKGSGSWITFAPKFAAYAAQVAAHYGTQVHAIEVFNEPDDLGGFPIAPVDYGVLFRATATAIKEQANHPKVITAGLTSSASSNVTYWNACSGLGLADGFAMHPYAQQPSPAIAGLPNAGWLGDYLRIVHRAFPSVSLWITEIGLQCFDAVGNTKVAAYMNGIYALLKAYSYVACCVWYAWSDGMNAGFGITSASQQPKQPVYGQFMALATGNTPPPVVTPPIPPIVPPTPPSIDLPKDKIGVGLYDPEFNQQFRQAVYDSARRRKIAGRPYAGWLVMNDIEAANTLVDLVRTVVFRWSNYDTQGHFDESRCDTQEHAIQYANEMYVGWASIRDQLDPRIMIAPVCEMKPPALGDFMLRWMQLDDAGGQGRKSAIFGFAPQATDLTDYDRHLPAYAYAAQHGHRVALHVYGAGTNGELASDQGADVYAWWRPIWKLLGANAPRIIVSEYGASDAVFVNAQRTVGDLTHYNTLVQPDMVEAIMYWMMGTDWQKQGKGEANSALPDIEAIVI